MIYRANVFGWTTLIEADTKSEALSIAKQRAPSASLRSADVDATHLRRATEDDVAWWKSMNGAGA